jgi:P-type conjugative transfer protein TrbJ
MSNISHIKSSTGDLFDKAHAQSLIEQCTTKIFLSANEQRMAEKESTKVLQKWYGNTRKPAKRQLITSFALSGILVAMLVAPAPPAHAQLATVCVNCADVFTQIAGYAEQVSTTINTAQQLATQIQQYQNMVQQGIALPSNLFNQITGDIQKIQSLYQQGQAMAGQLSNFDQQFRQQYPDFQTYLNKAGQTPTADQLAKNSQQMFDSISAAMSTAGLNVANLSSEDAQLASLVQQSQSATSRNAAIMAGNQIAAQQVQALQQLKQIANSQVQLQGAFIANQLDQQTSAQADSARDAADRAAIEARPGGPYGNSKSKDYSTEVLK